MAARRARSAGRLRPREGELRVQQQVEGPLAMVQAIADRGRLLAVHANAVGKIAGLGVAARRANGLAGLEQAMLSLDTCARSS